jgi:PAS domain S-box-containing protein
VPDLKKQRVLHVANDDGNLLRALLSDGHEVTETDRTSQALDPTALEQFDYIVIERPSPGESALRESEKRFRATFEQAAVGVAHSSLDGRLLLMNQKLCDIVGYTPEEIVTKSYQEVTHPDDLVAELEYARRLIAGEVESCSYEKRYIRKDGAFIWVNLTASVVRDEETGEPYCFVAIIQDISARKAAEEALRDSEEFNRRIVESSSDCIKILDLEGTLLYISERGQKLLGIEDTRPYINSSWIELWPGEGQRRARAAIEQAKESGLGMFQAFGPTPQGQAKWWDTVITPITDAQGRLVRLLAISRDITESKQAEESLKSALEEVRLLKDRLQEENVYLREEAKLERHFGEIVGRSDAIRRVLRKIEEVAPTDATVLVTGETGTGKERVARAIHGESPRRDRPLVKVNCAALSPTLIESELFGHEKGSFTGALGRKAGRFELADGATIFLDEIGELPIELQPKLLRVLQDGEFERLGSAHNIRADVRVIAATNRDLWKDVQARRFRTSSTA